MLTDQELQAIEERALAATETRYAQVTRTDVPRLCQALREIQKLWKEAEDDARQAKQKMWANYDRAEKAEAERDCLRRVAEAAETVKDAFWNDDYPTGLEDLRTALAAWRGSK